MTNLTLAQGDITAQQVEAIVNAANASLSGGGGVDGAIHTAAGPELIAATRPLAPCPTGEAKLTPGFRLPAKYVIHTVGPVFGVAVAEEVDQLAHCYRASLDLALKTGIKTIAFPSISTGAYGYPIEEAAPIAVAAVKAWLAGHFYALAEVRFVLFTDHDYRVYERVLRAAGLAFSPLSSA